MAIPSASVFPTSLDSSATLFGDPINANTYTLSAGILAGTTTLPITEDLTSLNVPTFLAFVDTGEIFYVTSKNVGAGTIDVERGAGAQAEAQDAVMKQILTAQYISQLKNAIIAIEGEVGIDGSAVSTSLNYFAANHTHAGGANGVNVPFTSISGTVDAHTLDGQHGSYYAPDADLTTAEGNISDSLLEEMPIMASIAPLSGVDAAPLELVESSGAGTAKPVIAQLRFDDTTDEGRMWTFRVKATPSGTTYLKILYRMASANTSDAVVWGCQLACISDTDGSVSAKVFATTNTITVTVPDTADVLDEATITLTNKDSIAKGDWVCLFLYRDADNGSDTAAGDAIVMSVALDYA